ncbi:SecDF P1 head subdomain-containing protein [Stenotrophomonas maltophilia]|uniref:SecDF P1 head subdomain-containing protein n=1 Tax=Stenotrophomonas maltophilia TaxID=40324 RepID=UPI003B9FD008
MRSHLLIVILALGAGLGACTQTSPPQAAADAPAGVSPLAQARIQMREVAAEAGGSNSTTLTDRDGNALPLLEPAFITTGDIASVAVGTDGHNGQDTLVLRFTDAAAPRILAATEARVGKRVAFTIGDQVLNVAVIAGPFAQSMQVTGLDGSDEAHRLFTEITGKAP